MIFYDHIIRIHEVHNEVEALVLDREEKQAIIDHIEQVVHQYVLQRILDKLMSTAHISFLERFHQMPYDKQLMVYLKQHVPDIEYHIETAADEIKFDLIKTIREIESLV